MASQLRVVLLIDDTLEQRNDYSGERWSLLRFGDGHRMDDAWELFDEWIDDTNPGITLSMIQIFRIHGMASELQSRRENR